MTLVQDMAKMYDHVANSEVSTSMHPKVIARTDRQTDTHTHTHTVLKHYPPTYTDGKNTDESKVPSSVLLLQFL